MDYAGEQQMELEALEAIFMDELQVYNGTLPSEWAAVGNTYIITLTPADEGDEDAGETEELEMEFLFAHTERYPEEAPCIKLQPVYGLSDSEIATCFSKLQEEVESNIGMAMIYTLITAAKDWLRDRATRPAEEDPEAAAKRAADEEEAKRQAARAHGTPVTVDTFKAWKQQYDADKAALLAKAQETAKDDDKLKRMTGKQYFMAHKGDTDTIITESSMLSDDDEYVPAEEGDEDDEFNEEDEDEMLDEDDLDYEDDDDEGMLDELDPVG